MALVNCPECGKEISNTVKKCPYCGFKIKKTSKLIPIGIGAVMCCSVIVGAIVYYRATNLQIDSSQNAAMIAVECVKDTLLNPDSIIVYDCNVSHYDVAFYVLIYRLEEIPEYATENGYNVYLHIGSQNRSGGISEEEYAIILSEDGALINFSDSDDGLAFQTNDLAWIKYSNSEIKDILALMDTKKRIHVKKSEKNIQLAK